MVRFADVLFLLVCVGISFQSMAPLHSTREIEQRPFKVQYESKGLPIRNLALRGGKGDGDVKKSSASGKGSMNITKALKEVLFDAGSIQGVTKGLSQVYETIDKREARLVVLAEDCDEANYGSIMADLCRARNVSIIKGPDMKTLGEWSGLIEKDKNGNITKIRETAAVAFKNYGKEDSKSEAVVFLESYVKQHGTSLYTRKPKEDTKEDNKIAAKTEEEPKNKSKGKNRSPKKP